MTLEYGRMDPGRLNSIIGNINKIEKEQDMTTTEQAITAPITEKEIRRNIIREATGVEPMDLGNALGAALDALDNTAGEDGYERIEAVTEAVDRYRRAEALVNPTISYAVPKDGYASTGWYTEQATESLRIEVVSSTSVGRPLADGDNELRVAVGDELFLSLTEVRQLVDALGRAELVMSLVGPSCA